MAQLVSVIIPAFNAEHCIRECINSIILQDYPVELIIIDDTSTDNTYLVCSEFIEQYSNIQIHKITHSGVSAARNVGLKYAQGEYVLFCDADDKLVPGAIRVMVKKMESSSRTDLIVGRTIKRNSPVIHSDEQLSREEAIKRFFQHDDSRLLGTVCGKLFRRKVISEMTFDERISVGEDALFLFNYLLCSDCVQLITNIVYIHNLNTYGIIQSRNFDNYITALDASEKMIRGIINYKIEYLEYALNDLAHVLKRLLSVDYSSCQKKEIIDRCLSIIYNNGIKLSIREIPYLRISTKKAFVEYESIELNVDNYTIQTEISANDMGFMIMPALINMHIHLEDYSSSSNKKEFSCTEDFLCNKEIDENIGKNVRSNIDDNIRDGCLTLFYSHKRLITPDNVDIIRLAGQIDTELDELGWMINRISRLSKYDVSSLYNSAKETDRPVFVHLSYSIHEDEIERSKYDGSFIHYLDDNGILSNMCYFIHCNYLTDEELTLISKRNAHVIICPISSLNLGEHCLDVNKLDEYGVDWMIGTDSYCSAGTSSIIDNLNHILDSHPNISPDRMLYLVTLSPVESSKRWSQPIKRRFSVISINSDFKSDDFFQRKYNILANI